MEEEEEEMEEVEDGYLVEKVSASSAGSPLH